MARGWGRSEEDLEAEKEQAREEKQHKAGGSSPEDAQRQARHRSIELSLARIREQLQRVSNPDRRRALEAAKRELEEQLGKEGISR